MEQELFSTFSAIVRILIARRKLCDSAALQNVATDSDESAIEPAAEPGRDAPQSRERSPARSIGLLFGLEDETDAWLQTLAFRVKRFTWTVAPEGEKALHTAE